MSRQAELRENVLAAKLEGLIVWIIAHRIPVLIAVGAAVAAVLIGSVFMIRHREAVETATTRLAQAQALLGARQYEQSEKVLSALRNEAPASLSARILYYQGVAAIGQKNFEKAEQALSEAAAAARDAALLPLVLSNLGFAQEELGKPQEAARTYRRFMDRYADHFLAPRIQLALGRALLAAGQSEEARKELSNLIDLYPTSEWAEKARALMDKETVR